jgi:hypothetical protein
MPNLDRLDFREPVHVLAADSAIEAWIVSTIAAASNKARLRRRLEAISSDADLPRFLHRFLLFNDALAARVPFVAGLIHLTPNVFLDPEGGVEFCQQVNGRVAAYVAEAASDEYRMINGRSSVHQHLSQIFFNGTLAYYSIDRSSFDRNNPFPLILREILNEARDKFLVERSPEMIFRALGFHVGLEFFADQEFNLVDSYLNERHPELVATLKQDRGTGSDYAWLALHTVVEIGHYRAGMEALNTALRYYRHPPDVPKMAERIKEGFNAFIDLQSRYYDAILCDVA